MTRTQLQDAIEEAKDDLAGARTDLERAEMLRRLRVLSAKLDRNLQVESRKLDRRAGRPVTSNR